jgi:hypothetical protein
MSHGIQINGAFTWARSIDNSSATLAGDQFSNSLSTLDSWYNLPSGRALADFNIGRTGVLSVIWEAPGLKSSSGVANWLASGWQLGTIFKVADGTPFTPTFGSDGDVLGKLNGDSFDYPNRLGGSGCNSLINSRNTAGYIKTQCFAVPTAPNAAFFTAHCDPTFGTLANLQCAQLRGNSGRNIINGPGITNLDFSVFKNNRMPKLSENFNIQFRAEFFNVLNHANYNPPPTTTNTDIFAPDGTRNAVAGRLKSAAEAREIQFAIKVVF